MEHPTMTTPEEADLQGYGAVSPLAVGALLVGLASFLAMSSLLLLVIPVLGVLLALFALRQIATSDGALIGKVPATIGLAAALLFASIAIASVVSRNRLLESQAKEFGDAWVQLVRDGDLERAHQLHLSADQRQLPGTSLARFYNLSKTGRDDREAFFRDKLARQLVDLDPQVKLQSRVVESSVLDKLEHIAIRYRDASGDDPIDFMLVVEREQTDDGGLWRVVQLGTPSDASYSN